ncbi:MAG TPA: hypothetical protein ENH00_03215 [Actinobacteria bacterium]|nr:hypothetical protein [Actinomycetota bacterium]
MSDIPSTPKHCAGKTANGKPCTQTILVDGVYCVAHAETAEVIHLRDAARADGGHARSNAARLMKLVKADPLHSDLFTKLAIAFEEVHDGVIAPNVANAMASLSRPMLALITSLDEAKRLSAVEASVASILETLESYGRRVTG